jgi:hypothetical protein
VGDTAQIITAKIINIDEKLLSIRQKLLFWKQSPCFTFSKEIFVLQI